MNQQTEKKQPSYHHRPHTLQHYLRTVTEFIKSTYHKITRIFHTVLLRYSKIEGKNNYVPYLPPGCIVRIFGDNNRVEIDPSVSEFAAKIEIGEPKVPVKNCTVKVGKNCICNEANILLFENNSSVNIGDDCIFSFGIEIWGSDSHSIFNEQDKQLINWGKEISIGNHVWVGIKALILKNSRIADDCVVGAGSIVTGTFDKPHCALAGNPARVVKEGISWDKMRPVTYQEKFQQNKN